MRRCALTVLACAVAAAVPAGGDTSAAYYGAKEANTPLHVQPDLDDTTQFERTDRADASANRTTPLAVTIAVTGATLALRGWNVAKQSLAPGG